MFKKHAMCIQHSEILQTLHTAPQPAHIAQNQSVFVWLYNHISVQT